MKICGRTRCIPRIVDEDDKVDPDARRMGKLPAKPEKIG